MSTKGHCRIYLFATIITPVVTGVKLTAYDCCVAAGGVVLLSPAGFLRRRRRRRFFGVGAVSMVSFDV